MQLAACIHQQAPRDLRKMGSLIVPRRQFPREALASLAGLLRRRSCALRASCRVSATILRVLPRRPLRMGEPLGTALALSAAAKWSVNSLKRCSAQRRLAAEAENCRPDPEPRRRRSARSQRCGSSGRWFGPRGRARPKSFEELPAEVAGRTFSRCLDACRREALSHGPSRISSSAWRASAFALHLTTPARSWNINHARSLAFDRG